MATPRRRLIRSMRPEPLHPQLQRRINKQRARLDHERLALSRWQKRLRRAFNAVEKCQKTIARIERQLTRYTP